MKFFPLVWAALWRKPARTILTLLSAIAAFTLFGLAVGVNATYAGIRARARPDRFFVSPHFDGGVLTLAQRDQIARMDGVVSIGTDDAFIGYYRDPKNRVVPDMGDHGAHQNSDVPLTPSQWAELEADPAGVIIDDHTAARYGLKPGDAFPVLTSPPWPGRRDGSRVWPFTVIAIIKNPLWARGGLVLGNYDYLDKGRPAELSGTLFQLSVELRDPRYVGEFTDKIDRMFANSPHPTWSISDETLAQISNSYQFNIPLMTEGVAAAGLFMILFLIGNGIAQSVRERIPEFAMLKTLGFSGAGVMALVFAEAAIPCFLGAAGGFAIALALAAKIATLSVLQKVAVAPPTLTTGVIAVGFAFAAMTAFVGAALPAWRVRRLDVATALRR